MESGNGRNAYATVDLDLVDRRTGRVVRTVRYEPVKGSWYGSMLNLIGEITQSYIKMHQDGDSCIVVEARHRAA